MGILLVHKEKLEILHAKGPKSGLLREDFREEASYQYFYFRPTLPRGALDKVNLGERLQRNYPYDNSGC